jgi:hypothetical protein
MRKRNVKLPSEKPKATMESIHETMKGGEELDISELARAHGEDMLGALVSMAKREGKGRQRAPHSVAATSAKTVLEIGYGRAATKESEHVDTGLTIIVNNLMTGEKAEKIIDIEALEVDVSKPVEIQAEAVNLAQDLVDFAVVLDKPTE